VAGQGTLPVRAPDLQPVSEPGFAVRARWVAGVRGSADLSAAGDFLFPRSLVRTTAGHQADKLP